jgi:Lipocalin-like domain
MRKQRLLWATIAAFVLLAVTGCDKDDDDQPAAKTKTELITTSTWKFSSATVGGSDVSAFLQTCQKDNILTFVATGLTGTVDEGATKCNAGDPQTSPFTWSFASGETQVNISATLFTGGSSTFTLVSLSETQLVLSQNITVGGTTQNAVVTFVH